MIDLFYDSIITYLRVIVKEKDQISAIFLKHRLAVDRFRQFVDDLMIRIAIISCIMTFPFIRSQHPRDLILSNRSSQTLSITRLIRLMLEVVIRRTNSNSRLAFSRFRTFNVKSSTRKK